MRDLLLVLLLTAPACFTTQGDPSKPSAEGTLTLAPNTDISAFQSLELHFDRVDGTYGESTTDVLEPPFAFPMQFFAGLGFGTSDAHTYRLSAWFSNATQGMPTTAPPAGAAHGQLDIAIPDCTDGCAAVRDVALQLAP